MRKAEIVLVPVVFSASKGEENAPGRSLGPFRRKASGLEGLKEKRVRRVCGFYLGA